MLTNHLLLAFKTITKLSGISAMIGASLPIFHTFGIFHWYETHFHEIAFSMFSDLVYGFVFVFILPWQELVKSITLMGFIDNLETRPIGLDATRKRKHYKYLFIQLVLHFLGISAVVKSQSSTKPLSDSEWIDVWINPRRSLFYRANMLLIFTCCNCIICYLSTELEFTFKLINWQIASFARKIDATTQELNLMRRSYSMAIRSCQAADQFSRYLIVLRILTLVAFNPIVFIKQSYVDVFKQFYAFVVYTGAKLVLLIQLVDHLVALNSASHSSLQELHKISMRNDVDNQEIKLFLMRMNEKNVGFTFLQLFTIDRQFITSLLTFSLTIILAIPTFISLYNE
uniref:Gustatory receptor n=1 Tax=Tetranychus urticae TaxID=32264 RepID=T1JWN1_TETUR